MGRNFVWGTSKISRILGPLLFNIFLCDVFFIINDVEFARYADDNTPFFVGDDLNDVILKLQNSSENFSNTLVTTKSKLTQISVILFVALA